MSRNKITVAVITVAVLFAGAYLYMAETEAHTPSSWIVYGCKGLDLKGAPVFGVPVNSSLRNNATLYSVKSGCTGMPPSQLFLVVSALTVVGALIAKAREIERER